MYFDWIWPRKDSRLRSVNQLWLIEELREYAAEKLASPARVFGYLAILRHPSSIPLPSLSA